RAPSRLSADPRNGRSAVPVLRHEIHPQGRTDCGRSLIGRSMKILVVGPSWIGDTVLAQPLLTLLHERHHSLALDVLAPAWASPVLTRIPEVRRTIASPFEH